MKKYNKVLILFVVIFIIISSFAAIKANEDEINEDVSLPIREEEPFHTLDEDANLVELDTEPALIEEVVPDFSNTEFENIGGARSGIENYLVLDYANNNKVLKNFNDFSEAYNYTEENSSEDMNLGVFSRGMTKSIKYGVVNFNTKGNATTNYTEDQTNKGGYTNGAYGADAALLGVNKDGSKVKFMMAGVVGWVNRNEVQLIDYDKVASVSFYTVTNGRLIHKIPTNLNVATYPSAIDVGEAPEELIEANKRNVYYSYDGHYFYHDYKTMIDDYKAGTYNKAINAKRAYYNYYQFLPHRSLSSVSAEKLDNYANTFDANSKMKNQGKFFKDYEKKYGVNALLMFGVAMNESARGTSYIAQTKNNLFGHAAYDSNPGAASGYSSVAKSIQVHSESFISQGYANPSDWRYEGSHLGDKGSGINVRYASDPYWGEKAAAMVNYMERTNKINREKRVKIGFKNFLDELNVRRDPNLNKLLFSTKKRYNHPFVIVDTVNGASIDGTNKWYKVLSDPVLDSGRNSISSSGVYNGDQMYGFVLSKYVNISGESWNPISRPATPQHSTTPPTNKVKKGDVNGDGKINHMDYIMIRNHISGNTTLTGWRKEAADFNNDNKVNHMDYIGVRNFIVGRR